MRGVVVAYVAAVWVAAVGAVALLGHVSDRTVDAPLWAVAAFGLVAAAGQVSSTRLSRADGEGEAFGHEEALVVLLALALPPLEGLAAFGVGVLLGQTLVRWHPFKVFFNFAQFVGAAAAGLTVTELVAAGEAESPRRVFAVLVGVLVFTLCNRLSVAGALALSGAMKLRDNLADDLGRAAVFWAGSVSIGVLAGLGAIEHPWALPFVLAALVALNVAFSGHLRARRERQSNTEVLRVAPAPVFSVDRLGRIRTWNPEMERITRTAASAARGRELLEVVSLRDEDGAPAEGLTRPGSGWSRNARRTLRLDTPGPMETWLTLSRAELPQGGFAFVGQDVTEQRESALRIAKAEEKFRRHVEHLPVASYSVMPDSAEDVHLRTSHIGSQIQRMVGYSVDELARDPTLWERLVHPDDKDRYRREVMHARSTSDRFASEYRLVRRDGAVVWVHDECLYLRDDQGTVVGMEGYLADITERKQLESSVLQAQRLDAVGRVAGGIAHDFNNLLTAVAGYADLVRGHLDPAEPAREYVDEIVKAGERATALTRQLLAFSRKQLLQPRIVNVNDVVDESRKLLARLIGEDIVVSCDLDPDVGAVEVDPVQLEQVILNLALNARDAMPTGGLLTIVTAPATVARPRDLGPGDYVAITVADTGVGMDAATRDRVFEPFFTTKEAGKGTGLGLATVFGIVQQSGGTVEVDSQPGEGTTFTIYLPDAGAPQPREDDWNGNGHARWSMPRGSETVLLVEDDEQVRRFAREVLVSCGYTVLAAEDAGRALDLASTHERAVDLLLTDVVMPGLSGRELGELLRPRHPHMEILYTSGYTDDAVLRHGVREAEVEFLPKPMTPTQLARKVRDVLDRRSVALA